MNNYKSSTITLSQFEEVEAQAQYSRNQATISTFESLIVNESDKTRKGIYLNCLKLLREGYQC